MADLHHTANQIAQKIRQRASLRGWTEPATVVDASPIAQQGYMWAIKGGTTIKVFVRTLDDVQNGDVIFVRKMTADRNSFWAYDQFGYRQLGDGSYQYQPQLRSGA